MTQDIDVGKLAEQINDKADRDLWNTVPNVWDNTLNTSQITNCITEIPQDIKLELNNGTLTLKAGSKVYVPNGKNADGSNKFDVITIAADKPYHWDYTGGGFVMVYLNGSLTVSSTGSETVGSVTPAKTFKIFYNTTDNKCYFDDSTTSSTQVSFPIARFTATGAITSIDQVFNGFGYIGSTVFALPGVKGLIPSGRNADGSLKNIEKTLDKVILFDFGPEGYTGSAEYIIGNDSTISNSGVGFHVSDEGYLIDEYDGIIKKSFVFARGYRTSGKITSFTPKTAFHAVDRNDVDNHIIDIMNSNYANEQAPTSNTIAGQILKTVNGGKFQIYKGVTSAAESVTVTLPSPFNNANYAVAACPMQGSSNTSDTYVTSKTTTSFVLTEYVKKSISRNWIAYGYYSN